MTRSNISESYLTSATKWDHLLSIKSQWECTSLKLLSSAKLIPSVTFIYKWVFRIILKLTIPKMANHTDGQLYKYY